MRTRGFPNECLGFVRAKELGCSYNIRTYATSLLVSNDPGSGENLIVATVWGVGEVERTIYVKQTQHHLQVINQIELNTFQRVLSSGHTQKANYKLRKVFCTSQFSTSHEESESYLDLVEN